MLGVGPWSACGCKLIHTILHSSLLVCVSTLNYNVEGLAGAGSFIGTQISRGLFLELPTSTPAHERLSTCPPVTD